MKISNILTAFIILFSVACTTKSEHGHEHGIEEHGHSHDEDSEDHEQEEFTTKGDSVHVANDSTGHTHEDGSEHHGH